MPTALRITPRLVAELALVLVLGLEPARAQQLPSEARDYPDITYWQAFQDERREDLKKARAEIASRIEHLTSIGGAEAEIDKLRAVDAELERSATRLEAIIRYEHELDELEDMRKRLEQMPARHTEREVAFEREKAAPEPRYPPEDLRRAEDELAMLAKMRDALRAKVRAAPRQIEEARAERNRALDEYLKLDPAAVDRETLSGAKRERLKLDLAYYDSYLEFLPERLELWKRRSELLAREERLLEARVRFIRGVLSGRVERERELAAKKAELEARIAELERRRAATLGGTAEAVALAAEVRDLEEERWFADLRLRALADQEVLEGEIPFARQRIAKFQAEAAASREEDPGVLAADAERTRGFVERRAKAVEEQVAKLAAMRPEIDEHIRRNERAIDEAARSNAARPEAEGERIMRLRALIAAIEREREPILRLETELLRAQESLAAETAKILKIRERALIRAEEQRSLFDRRPWAASRDALRDALAIARSDLAALRAGGGGARPAWQYYAAGPVAAAAVGLFFLVRRKVRDALRRIS